VRERGDQHRVLEHVGVIAGMEGVAVAEHPSMVTPGPLAGPRICLLRRILRIIAGFAAF
jgi:hypothetical protein